MGQYYIAILLGHEGEAREFIRCWLESYSFGGGAKLMEHAFIGNGFMEAVERLLSPLGPFWKSRLVWAGDYADSEPGYVVETNLHRAAYDEEEEKRQVVSGDYLPEDYIYVVNHTKKQYFIKDEVQLVNNMFRIHPLPILTAEGNGRGGGDYRGTNQHLVGSWARNVISVEKEVPKTYQKLICEFSE